MSTHRIEVDTTTFYEVDIDKLKERFPIEYAEFTDSDGEVDEIGFIAECFANSAMEGLIEDEEEITDTRITKKMRMA